MGDVGLYRGRTGTGKMAATPELDRRAQLGRYGMNGIRVLIRTPATTHRRPAASTGHRRPLRGRLLVLLAAFLSFAASCGTGKTPGNSFTTDATVALRTYTALVEQHLSSVLASLTAVAATDTAASGQWDRIRPALAEVAGSAGTTAAVWYARPDGSYYTVDAGLASANLSDRSYFPGLMAGRPVMADLVVSKSTGKMSAIIAAPIRSAGKVTGGLGASVDLAELSAMVNRVMALPSDTIFYAIDSQARTALHVEGQNIFAYPSQMGSPTLGDAVQKMLRSPHGSVTYTYNGAPRTVVFTKSNLTGWTFALGRINP